MSQETTTQIVHPPENKLEIIVHPRYGTKAAKKPTPDLSGVLGYIVGHIKQAKANGRRSCYITTGIFIANDKLISEDVFRALMNHVLAYRYWIQLSVGREDHVLAPRRMSRTYRSLHKAWSDMMARNPKTGCRQLIEETRFFIRFQER